MKRSVRAGDGAMRILRVESAGPASDDHNRWVNNDSMKWSRWKIALFFIVLTTLVGFAEALQVYIGLGAQGRELSWSSSMASTMPSWFVLAALLPITVWLARRFRLDEESSWRRALPVHLVAAVLFTAIHIGLSSWLSDYVFSAEQPQVSFMHNVARVATLYFVIDTLFYWGILAVIYAFEYGRRYRERERTNSALALKASRLETSLSRANLEALRMQLNPHFLFNTLNTISVLAMKGEKARVVRMINRLSDLLRLSLENSRQTVTLAEELEFVERYLEIEQVRFRDRLAVEVDVPADLMSAEVPSLLLQPLVENAVLHGVSQQLDGGLVRIEAKRLRDRLALVVRDTGPGFQEHDMRNGTGVGLGNTAARLEQLYPGDHSLEQGNAEQGGAVVSIEIPYRVLAAEPQEEVQWRKSAP